MDDPRNQYSTFDTESDPISTLWRGGDPVNPSEEELNVVQQRLEEMMSVAAQSHSPPVKSIGLK